MDQYNKSLALLDKFLAETSSDDLAALIRKHNTPDVSGPTFTEYMDSFEYEFRNASWANGDEPEVAVYDCLDFKFFMLEDECSYYAPPPIIQLCDVNKDSVIFAESFFLV